MLFLGFSCFSGFVTYSTIMQEEGGLYTESQHCFIEHTSLDSCQDILIDCTVILVVGFWLIDACYSCM